MNKSIYDVVYKYIALPLMVLMVLTSRSHTTIKYALLGFVSSIMFIEILISKTKFDRVAILLVTLLISYSSFNLLIGMLNGYSFNLINDRGLIQYYFITPFLVLLLSTSFSKNLNRVYMLEKTIRLLIFLVPFLDVCKLLAIRGVIPDIDVLGLIMVANNNQTDSTLALRVSNEYALMFLLPLAIVLFFNDNDTIKRRNDAISMVLGFVYCLLSGRKALAIEIVAVFLFLLLRRINEKNGMKTLFRIVLIATILILLVDIMSVVLGFDNIFLLAYRTLDSGLNAKSFGIQKRLNNMDALLELWAKSPLLGNGLSSYAAQSLASKTTKWSYEVVYMSMLARLGVIGISIFIAIVMYLTELLRSNYKSHNIPIIIAVHISFIGYLFTGATNPMIYVIWPWLIVATFAQCSYNNELDHKQTLGQ